MSDSWWNLIFGVAPDHDGCSIRRPESQRGDVPFLLPLDLKTSGAAGRNLCGDTMAECRLLAKNGSSNHLRATSACHPASDIRWPMSVIVRISSGLPPGTDVPGGVAEGPLVTHNGSRQHVLHLPHRRRTRPASPLCGGLLRRRSHGRQGQI